MELYRRYISQLFEKLVTCRRFAQIRIPTEANAAESGLDPQDYIRRMDRAYDVDYDAVRAACEPVSYTHLVFLRQHADEIL